MTFKPYRRKQIAELRPYEPGENLFEVSISAEDRKAGSPKPGDMIARNPKNHKDQWLVAAAYFAENFEALSSPAPEAATDWGWHTPKDGVPQQVDYPAPTPDAAEELEVVAWSWVNEPNGELVVSFSDQPYPASAIPLTSHSAALAIIENLRAENYLLRNERNYLGDNLHESETRSEARLAEAVEAMGKMHFYIAAHEDAGMTREEALRAAYAAHDTFVQSLGKEV